MPLGDFSRMGAVLDEAEALAQTAGDQHRLGHALNFKAIHLVHGGDFVAALEHARRALAIGETMTNIGIQAVANWYRGVACLARGDSREAVRHCEAGIALALFLMLYRRKRSLDVSLWQSLREAEIDESRDDEPLPIEPTEEPSPQLPTAGLEPVAAEGRRDA